MALPNLQILLCAVLWGFAGPLIRWSHLSPVSVVAIRFALPVAFAYCWIRFVEKRTMKPIGKALTYASFLTLLGNVFFISSFSYTSISNVLLLLYTRPVIATVFASLLLSEHVTLALWLLLGLSFAGAAFIITSHDLLLTNRDLIGMGLSLACAATIALAWAIIKKYGYGSRSNGEIIFYQHFIGGVVALLYLPWVLSNSPVTGIFFASMYALVVGFICSLLYFEGLRRTTLSQAMPLTYAELIVAICVGIFWFGESLNSQSVLGGVMIITSATATLFIGKPPKLLKGIKRTPQEASHP